MSIEPQRDQTEMETRIGATAAMNIRIKRAYEAPAEDDGYRILVDRVWPRGRSRQDLRIDEWAREVAPGTDLRRWFGHQPERWEAFRDRYRRELAATDRVAELHALLVRVGSKSLTLVYGARDTEHNQAVVLAEVLRDLLPPAP